MKTTTGKNRGRGSGSTSPGCSERLKLAPLALAAALALGGVSALAGPTGGAIVAGSGSISQPDAQTTHVHQNSSRMTVEWSSFNLASDEQVNFYQPSSSAWVLNQILSGDASVIRGRINANGNVILVNGNGVYFGSTARLSVGSLIASSLGLSTQKFMNGQLAFERQGNSTGRVVNQGEIEAHGDGNGGGSVNLLGPSVENTGKIVAKAGRINLAVGERITLDFDGDGLMRFAVDEALKNKIEGLDAAIRNSGELAAEGGQVTLEGHVAQDVLYHVVNNEGIIRAGRIDNTGGVIRLVGVGGEGASVVNTGTLDAAGRDAQSTGGKVHVLGERVALTGEAVVDASGAKGGGEILIGGDFQGKNADVMNAQRTYVGSQVQLKADATEQGDGGKVIVWADDWTKFYGNISARGGENGGKGGFAEVSGKNYLDFRPASIDLRGPDGKGALLLDPDSITIAANNPDIYDDDTDEDLDALVDPNDWSGVDSNANSIITAGAIVDLLDTTDLVLTATTSITVDAAIDSSANTNANDLTLDAATINLNADISTNGAQTYDGNVVLGADVTLTAIDADITVTGDIDADLEANNRSLTLDAGAGNVSVAGAIGANEALASLTIDGDEINLGNIGGATAGVTGATAVTAATSITFNGTTYKTDGTQTWTAAAGYNLRVNGGATTFSTTAGDVSFLTSDVQLADGSNLVVNTTDGDITVGKIDGTSSEDVTLNSSQAVSVGAIGTGTLNGINTVSLTGISGVTLNGNIITDNTSGNSVTVNGPVTLGASVVIDTSANTTNTTGVISFSDTINASTSGVEGLTLTAGKADVNVGSAIGGSVALGSLTISANDITLKNIGVSSAGVIGATTITATDGDDTAQLLLEGVVYNTVGSQSYTGGTDGIRFASGGMPVTVTTAASNVSFAGTVQLANDAHLTVTTAGTAPGSGNISFGTITGTSSEDLTLNAGDANVSVGTIGGGNQIETVAITGAQITLNGNITTADSATNTVTLTGAVRLGANVTILTDKTTNDGAVTINGTVDSADATDRTLTITAGTANVDISGAVGATNDLASLSITAAQTTLGGNVTTTGAQSYTSALVLGGNVTLTANDDVTVTGTINADDEANARAMTINSSGTTTLGGVIGGVEALASLTTDAGGTTQINGGAVTTTGAQSYGDNVTLGADTTLATTNDGAVSFGGTVNSSGAARDLTINAGSGAITFSGVVGGVLALDVLALNTTDTIALNGNVTTTGAQSYGGAVRIDNDLTLTTTNSQVTFDSTVDSQGTEANDLTISTGTATVNFGAAVGSGTDGALGTLTITNTSASGVTLRAVNAAALNVTTAGAITDLGALVISGTTTLAAGSGNDITLDEASNDFGTVAITSGKDVTLVDTDSIILGASSVSGDLSVSSGGDITQSGAIEAGSGAVTLTGDNITLTNAGNTLGEITVNAGTGDVAITEDEDIDIAGITHTGDITLDATGSITGVIEGDVVTLTATTGIDVSTVAATIAFSNDTGGVTIVEDDGATVSGTDGSGDVNITSTTGDLTVGAAGISGGAGDVSVTATAGSVAVTGTVTTTDDGDVIVTAGDGTISGAGTIGGDVVTLNAVSGIQANTAATTIAFNNTTSGNVTIVESDGASVSGTDGGAGNVSVTSTTGGLTVTGITGNDGDISLEATAGAVTLNGAVTATGGGDVTVKAGSTISGAGKITADQVTLNAVTGISANTAAAAIAFSNSTSGNVTIIEDDDVTVSGTDGSGNVSITSTTGDLTVGASGISGGDGDIDLEATAGSVTVTGNVTATGGGDVTVTAGAAISGDGTIGGDVVTLNAVSGIQANTTATTIAFANTTSGNVTIVETNGASVSGTDGGAGNVSVTSTTGDLTVGATGINGGDGDIDLEATAGSVTVTGAVTADGAGDVTLNANALLTVNAAVSSGSGNLSLTGGTGVTHSAAGDLATTGGTISVTATTGNITMADGTVYSAGSGNVTLTAGNGIALGRITTSGNVTATAGGAITDATALEGAGNENIAANVVTLTAGTGIGATGAANDIDTAATQLVLTTTTGGIYIAETDGVQLGNGTGGLNTVTSGDIVVVAGGAITTGNTISTAGGGGVLLQADGISLGHNITTAGGAINLVSNVTLTDDVVLGSGAGSVAFDGKVNGGFALTVNSSGTTTFGGAVGDSAALTSLTTDAAGTTAINGGSVTTSGAQTYNDDVTLGADTVLTTTSNGAVSFGKTVNSSGGARNLEINTGSGNITFSGVVGGGSTLGALTLNSTGTTLLSAAVTAGSLTTNAGGTTALNGNVTTTGAQTYNDAVRINSHLTLQTTNSAVTFGSTVDSEAAETNNLAIDTGSATVVFGGAVGSNRALGTLNVTNTSSSGVALNAVTATALSVATNGAITDTGALVISGTTTLAAGAGNDITLDHGGNNFGTVAITSGNNVTLNDVNAIVLGTSTVSGNLSVTANGAITDSGALSVAGTTTLAAGVGNDITLDHASNNFNTVAIASGKNVTLVDTNAIVLGASAISGDLIVSSGGDISQSGAIEAGGGTVTLTGNNITLTHANNTLGAITVNAGTGDVAITEDEEISIAGITHTGGLTLNAGMNAITQTGAIEVGAGVVNLTGGAITLTHANNTMGAITVNAGTGNVSITEDEAIQVAGITHTGSLTLNAGTNAITQTGAINVGAGAVNLTGGAITLNQANVLGAITVNSGSGNVSITENDAILVAGITRTNGDLTLNAGANAITQTGAIEVDDGTVTLTGGTITLTNSANTMGAITVNAGTGNVSITEDEAIQVAGITHTGDLTLNAGTNAITQTGAINVGAGAVNLTGGAITLNQANVLGAITVNSGSGNVSITENDAILVAGITRTDGDLTLNAGANAITQTGAIEVDDGTVTLTGGTITLTNSANTMGAITVNAGTGNVSITEDEAIQVAGITHTGDLTLNAGTNAITQTGVINVGAGAVNLTGGAITLNQANVLGAITVNSGSGNVSITENDAILVAGITRTDGDLTLNAGTNAITQTGAIEVDDGAVTLTGGTITLTHANNTMGAITVNAGTGNVSITEDEAITVSAAGITHTGNVTLDAAGTISGAGTIGGNVVTLTATTGIDAKTAAASLDASVTGSGSIVIDEADAVVLSDVDTVNGSITITAAGAITATDVSASGAGANVSLSTSSGNIVLGEVSATDTVTLTAAGAITDNNAAAANVIAQSLSASAATGIDLDTTITTLTSASVSGTGNIDISDTAGDLAVTSATTNNGSITLNATGGNLTITTVTAGGAGSGVTLTATGAITDSNGAAANVIATSLSASAATGIDLDTTITTLTSASVSGTGNIDISDTAGGLAVTSATTNNGSITLNATGGDLTATVVTAAGAGSDVTLSTTTSGNIVLGEVSATDTVTLTAAGAITDNNAAAANVIAQSLSASAATGIDLDTTITTLTSASVSGTGNIDISDTAGGLAVTSATTNNGSITLNATGGNLTITTVTAGGAGSDVTLSTTTSGNIVLGEVSATDTVTLTAAGAITDNNAAAANVIAQSLSASAATGIDLDTTITTLTSATVSGTGNIDISDTAGGLAVTSATTNNGSITLNATGGNLAVGTVTAGGAGSSVTLTATGAITDSNGAAANVIAASLSASAATGIDLDTTITTLTSASVSGTGNIDISDTAGGLAVTSATTNDGSITLSATGGNLAVGTVTAGGAGSSVTLTATGAITDSNGAAANVIATSLSASAATGIDLDTTITTLTSASVSGTGNIDISDTAGGLAVTSATTNNGSITLNATGGDLTVTTVTAGGAGSDVTLSTTTSGNVVLGTVTAADDVTITAAGSILLGNNISTTGGDINLGSNVTLTNAVVLSSGAGDITFGGTVDGGFALTANSSGTTTFEDEVGGSVALTTLTTDAAGTTAINGGLVRTTGAQTYGDNVTLGADTVLTTTSNGAVSFGGTVNSSVSARDLTINAGSGNITFNGIVGGVLALDALTLNSTGTTLLSAAVTAGNLTTNAGGTTALNGNVTTTGAQTYNDAVRIDNDLTLQTTNSAVTFGSTVDSEAIETNDLTISTGTATVSFGGAVGDGAGGALGTLTISNSSASGVALPKVTAAALSVTTGGQITDTGNLTIAGNAAFDAVSAAITLNNSNNFGSLTFKTTGAVQITEASDTQLTGANTAGSLVLTSTGALTDDATATLGVTDNASFSAASIELGDQAGNVVNFGSLTFSSAGAVAISEDSDTQLAGANTANSLVLVSSGALTDDPIADLNVTGNASLNAASIELGDQAGNDVNFGSLTVNSAGAVTITEDSATELTGTNLVNTLNLMSAGAITDAAATSLTVTGLATFNANNGGSDITLGDDAGDTTNFGSVNLRGATVTVTEDSAMVLAGLDATTATLTADGSITTTGSATLTTTGQLTLNAGANAITIAAGDTANFGTLRFTGGVVNISEDSDMVLTGTNTASSLTLTSAGTITDDATASLSVTNNASFSGTSITLGDQGGNVVNFGSLTFNSAGLVSITEDSATQLSGTSTANILNLISAGAITDASGTSLTVTEQATFDAGSNAITLGDNASDTTNFGALNFTGGAVSIAADSAVELTGTNTASSLTLSSAGAITDDANADLSVSGHASFSAASIELGDQAGNVVNFGSLTFSSAGAVSITEDSATELSGTNTANILNLVSGGAITDAAGTSLTVTAQATFDAGSNAITLGDNVSDTTNFGALNFTGGAVSIAEDSAMELTGTNTASSLTLTSAGAITDDANADLSVTGNASFSGTSITLGDQAGNDVDFGSLTFNSAGTADITEDSAMELAGASTAGSLTLNANGNITQTGAVAVTGTTTIVAGANDVVLDDEDNDFGGTVTITSAGALTLNDVNALTVVSTSTTGEADLTAGGNLTVSGVFNDELVTNAGGTTSFGATTVGGLLSVTSGDHISQTGAIIKTSASAATFTISGGANKDILLGTQANDFDGGSVTFATSNGGSIRDISLRDIHLMALLAGLPVSARNIDIIFNNAAVDLPTLLATGNLSVTAGGAITDSGNLSVAGTTTLTAGAANDVTLDNANDFGGAVSIVSDNNVTLNDVNAIVLGTSSISGDLHVTANGAITDSGVITVGGTTTLSAGAANDITLDNANDFAGVVSIVSGNNVTLNDANAIVLGDSTVLGNLSVTASGAITDDGVLTVAGTTTLAAGSGNDITLDDEHDFGGAVSIASGRDVTLNDANAIILGASALAGDLIVTTGDDITVAGAITTQGGSIHLEADSPHAKTGVADGSGTLAFGAAGSLNSNGGDITLIAADFDLAAGSSVNAGTGDIQLALSQNSVPLTLGGGASILSAAELGRLHASGTLTLGEAMTAGAMQLKAENIVLDADINLNSSLAGTLRMSADNVALGGNVTTAGTQTYAAAVTLTGVRTLAGGMLEFTGTVTGDSSALTLTLNGDSFFEDAVAGVGALTINGDLTLRFNAASLDIGALNVSGTSTLSGNVKTTGAQNYGDDVLLKDGNRTLEGDSLDFGGKVVAQNGLTLVAYTDLTFSGSVEGEGSEQIEIRINQSGNADVELDLSGLSKLYSAVPILLIGGGQDALLGLARENEWTVTADGAGNLTFVDPDTLQAVTVSFEGFTRLVGGSDVDTFDVTGTFTGRIEGGAGNDILRLIGTGSVARFDGGSGTDTYDITGLATHPHTLVWNPNDIRNVETLLGDGDTLRLAGNNAVTWNLNGANAGSFTIGAQTVNFQGLSRLESSGNGSNTWTSNGAYAGDLQLNGRNEWLFQAATRLTQGQISGDGMLIIARRQGEVPTQNSDFTIGASDLALSDMTTFTGDLVIGGSITGSLPLKGTTDVEINANQLLVEESFATAGNVVLMGSDIVLNANFSAGSSSKVSLIAGGSFCNGCEGLSGSGNVVVQSPVTITAGGGQVIAAQGIENASRLTLAFDGGPLELAVGSRYVIRSQPSALSSALGVSLSSDTRAFIANLELELVSVAVNFTNPAASVLGVRAVEVIDLAVFEEDLTLFGLVGEGVALAFAQCEEVEGCTPNVTEDELNVALGHIQLRMRQLEAELEQTNDPARRKQIEELLTNFRSQQQEYTTYRSELQGLTEFEKQLESQFAAEENQVDQAALERQVKVVETIYTRVRFLESLRFNQERRKLFAERTGLELTDQRLKEIIDSTLKAAARAEARVENMLKGQK